jgi:hypothetical protein
MRPPYFSPHSTATVGLQSSLLTQSHLGQATAARSHYAMMNRIAPLECPHLSNTRLRYPALFGAGQVGTDMRTLFTAVNTWLLLWLRPRHSFSGSCHRSSNLALLLHDYVSEHYCFQVLPSNGCTWPQTDVKHT